MYKLGLIVLVAGGLVLLVSFGMDTAPEGTHNIGLLQRQMMFFQVGGLLALGGALATIVGKALARLEQAGILPPAGYTRPVQPPAPGSVE